MCTICRLIEGSASSCKLYAGVNEVTPRYANMAGKCETFRLMVIRHAKQVVEVCRKGERVVKGEAMQSVAIVEGRHGEGVSIVVDDVGKIECIDEDHVVKEKYAGCHFENEVDATGMCVIPGESCLNIL